MATKYNIHPETPQQQRIFEVVDLLKNESIMVFPTDSQYAIGCDYKNKKGIERIRKIRQLDKSHLFTLLCDSLSNISQFAHISDDNFKIIKRLIPGPYTFVLPATKAVPKLLLNPKRKTIGFRVPDSPICTKLIEDLDRPLIATTAKVPDHNGVDIKYQFKQDLFDAMDKLVDVIVDDDVELTRQESTVISMTDEEAVIIRSGLGIDKAEEVFAQYDKPLVEEVEEV